jgi:hypothetical protein
MMLDMLAPSHVHLRSHEGPARAATNSAAGVSSCSEEKRAKTSACTFGCSRALSIDVERGIGLAVAHKPGKPPSDGSALPKC